MRFKVQIIQQWLSSKLSIDSVRRQSRRLPILLACALLVSFSSLLGWGMAIAAEPTPSSSPATIGTVDPVPPALQVGERIYLQRCATCHVGVPPEVLPNQSWARLIQMPDHYITQIQPISEPDLSLTWAYLRSFSRPFPRGETLVFRLRDSRFFKALHPRVDLPQPVTVSTCTACHINATNYDFRTLAPEWENAP